MEGQSPAGGDQKQGEAGGPHGAAHREPAKDTLEGISDKTRSVLSNTASGAALLIKKT